jgi:hypothetical protein
VADVNSTTEREAPAQHTPATDVAECGVCGRNKPVCCDEGYTDNEDGTRTHVGAVCVDCCDSQKGYKIYDGKSVAGGTYERCE